MPASGIHRHHRLNITHEEGRGRCSSDNDDGGGDERRGGGGCALCCIHPRMNDSRPPSSQPSVPSPQPQPVRLTPAQLRLTAAALSTAEGALLFCGEITRTPFQKECRHTEKDWPPLPSSSLSCHDRIRMTRVPAEQSVKQAGAERINVSILATIYADNAAATSAASYGAF